MKKFAKVFSLILAGTMVFSMPVSAKSMGSPEAVYLEPESNVGEPCITVVAIDAHETVDEYMGNTITDIWAMDYVAPIGQGGCVVLDGVQSNVTFVLQKPELSRVYSAKELAASMGESLVNVVKFDTHVGFDTANVNFYAPGYRPGDATHVFQYNDATDSWDELNITEAREDHICVDVHNAGTLAFIDVYVVE